MKLLDEEIVWNLLYSKERVLELLTANGSNYQALNIIQDAYIGIFGNELIWTYPICDGDGLGGMIVPVKEGILWLPYNEVLRVEGEVFDLNAAVLLDTESLTFLKEDFLRYQAVLIQVLDDAIKITQYLTEKDGTANEIHG